MLPEHECLVMTLGMLGKHEKHEPHDWWYTSSGGGHQLDHYDPSEKNCKQWHCPGRP